MKYGVVCTSQTRNLGDDIQSLAAIHFLRKNGITDYVCVEREELNSYSGEPLALITNGWFLHKFHNFPPSDKIKPLFIGFFSHYPELIEVHRQYFKKHEPIGCRSATTLAACKENDIEAYLSGCLTLGFDESSHKEPHICVVDVDMECVRPNNDFKEYARAMGKSLIYTTHDRDVVGVPFSERLDMAQSLLHLYSRASLVVTGRLHCVLPCRALNTPAAFIHPDHADARFKGLEDVITGAVPDPFFPSVVSIRSSRPWHSTQTPPRWREHLKHKKTFLDKSFRELLDRA